LLLITLEDMSYTEVAKVTGVPVGTVMSRLSRARERMRALMDVPTTAPVAQPAPVVHQTPSLRVLK
jgi:RNA polymerase sigma-70 factor (ECF subfamily)